MIKAFYSGVAGSKSYQTSLNVTANNIANVNTAGYQSQQTNFADLVYTGITPTVEGGPAIASGNGTKAASVTTNLKTGAFTPTGRRYDYMIEGNGYFAVLDPGGNTYYTKNGNFYLDSTGAYLLTANGEQVLNAALSPLNLSVDRAKTDYTDMAETENMLTQAELPGVFTFINPAALTRDGNGRLSATGASGEAVADPNAKVISGALEGSNVDIARELTDLLSAQRGFELSAKVIQTADELENIANNLRS